MKLNPITQFKVWFQEQLDKTNAKLPSACCLSTNGIDGYPNARFVSLKDVTETGFIVTGPITARKGLEIQNINKVGLTFWWSETERQIRIQGTASLISSELADVFFNERSHDSKIVSIVSKQGEELISKELLQEKYNLIQSQCSTIKRPDNWSGYLINPIRIEFLEFKNTRFHERTLFERVDNGWSTKKLQP